MQKKVQIGVHSLTGTEGARRLVQAGITNVKLVDDFGSAAEFLAINPDIQIIGRRNSIYPNDPNPRNVTAESLRHLSPQDAVNVWMDIQKPTYILNPLVKIWEGPNEPVWNKVDDMAWYGQFEALRVKALAALGLRAVVGCFSTGTPDITAAVDPWKWWIAFSAALSAARDNNGFLGVHEYSDGPMNEGFDGKYGWNVFRYRRVYDGYLSKNGYANLHILITEYGRLDYRKHTDDQTYANELIWADQELRKDNYVSGAHIFTFGSNNPAWDSYNADSKPLVDILSSYVANAPTINPVVTPPPSTAVLGFDVSHHQVGNDWSKIDQKYSFAIARCANGVTVDETFATNWSEMHRIGLISGTYQYFRPTQNPTTQANLLLNLIGNKYNSGDIRPILDVEVDEGSSNTQLASSIQVWINVIRSKTGVMPIMYSNQSFWNSHSLPDFGCELWIANYDVPAPHIPNAFKTWKIWQYTSKGAVSGINGNVDIDRWNGTLEELKAWVGTSVPVPQPVTTTFSFHDKDAYAWDLLPGAPEFGDTVRVPKGMDFDYVNQEIDITFPQLDGTVRTIRTQFLKPDVRGKEQAEVPDVAFPDGQPAVSHAFKAFAPLWIMYKFQFPTKVGKRYKINWKVNPDLVINYVAADGTPHKTAAPDPYTGWMRLTAVSGAESRKIDFANFKPNEWNNGTNFMFLTWFNNQTILPAQEVVGSVYLELMCPFGVREDGWFVAPPTIEELADPITPPPASIAVFNLDTAIAFLKTLSDPSKFLAMVKGFIYSGIWNDQKPEVTIGFTKTDLNLRDGPSLTAKVLKVLAGGVPIALTGVEKTASGIVWAEVALPRGWVSKSYLNLFK